MEPSERLLQHEIQHSILLRLCVNRLNQAEALNNSGELFKRPLGPNLGNQVPAELLHIGDELFLSPGEVATQLRRLGCRDFGDLCAVRPKPRIGQEKGGNFNASSGGRAEAR